MHPVLFEFQGAALQSYLLLFSLAYFVGLGVWLFENRAAPYPKDQLINLSLQTFFVGILGAKVLYLITRGPDLWNGELAWQNVWQGGVVFLGGAISAGAFLYWRLPKIGVARVAGFNTAAPALALAHAVGRLGCFLNGCCYGKYCALPWGVTYHNPLSPAQPKGLPLHPTQIYEAVALVLLGLFLLYWNHRRLRRDSWQSFEIYLVGYAGLRFTNEFFRGDDVRGIWGPFSTSQWLSLGLIFLGCALRYTRRKKLFKEIPQRSL